MSVNESGVPDPLTVEEINTLITETLVAAGVDLNVTNASDYTQTTNPIATLMSNLSHEQAAFAGQVQFIFNQQQIQIERAGIFTKDAILNYLLADEDIQKADVRNFAAGEITIYIHNDDQAILPAKDYSPLTAQIVPITCVGEQYVADTNNVSYSANAQRPNSLQITEVIYNVANVIDIITTDPANLLTVRYTTILESDETIENQKIDDALKDYFANIRIGASFSEVLIACAINDANKDASGNNIYSDLSVTFTNTTPINPGDIFIYTSADIAKSP